MTEPQHAHTPVMLAESLAGLAIRPDGFYVDCTFGRGGHARAILDRLGPEGRLLALDKDPHAVAAGEALSRDDARFTIEHASYAELRSRLESHGALGRVAGVLMDLGVSSPQLDDTDRGFSFLREGPLDMRMDITRGPTAAEWLATIGERELVRVLREYGEERYAGRIARAIVAARPLATTRELAEVIEKAAPSREKNKHPATRAFQAIRIAVNRELDDLDAALAQTLDVLQPGGRLVVIAFHSLEDRIVKRFIREQERGKPQPSHLPWVDQPPSRLKRIGKAQLPGREETEINVRARSAVLRVAERVAE
ncbi:16S rRNA (cytosine(1402)-N(4))-methyltransferase RsmH [Methylococcus sp. EFPC2]|uniref:16S rRNA (cytosine(1402)-N(4))-methyltransferase RsmH n=1 Tax=Methylococcus sp. EFPC2 TaxID=2812648 RepID=UPI0019682E8A|nr:16S rRNA (cytosine(1402)-N(4))-methyltransferase RsmH [Methylococcus sp. EFPC2]QSA95934.1 16S rRNA (cytosine(1402)-N(4))-methyltransferase RsmH [Methylococcus sp. EFPC2]